MSTSLTTAESRTAAPLRFELPRFPPAIRTEDEPPDVGRALKLELAKARLKVLRLAAVAAAAGRDGRRALAIAKEVGDVARELKAMDGKSAAPSPLPTTLAEVGDSTDSEVKALLAHARATLTIARKAAAPGSEEEARINRLLGEVGTPSVATDLAATVDGGGIDLSV
ncbi:hypothetical protein [Magnetospirillum sp. SS-4]|uniref:hypothetical protein n=1 Tax=Magnetospirillum sp. SS-4 TaxID=2681465 RepID=UPI0013859E63|nr:hypothetical protein [Magnetospirillum sp. SS-4]CAA7612951.1 hypothetical protein MTBSS4_10360 [Magnetospirillum sp. SS-4]